MTLSKQRISSPLEAGQSLLDANNLPPHLTGALDYVSKRLARKALHITLVVVRKGYQLPSSVPPTPTSPPATPDLIGLGNNSPSFSSARFASMSPVAGLRQLVRRGTNTSIASSSTSSSSSTDSIPRSAATSPTFSPPPTTAEALASPRRWPLTPLTPGTPMTPHTPCSIATNTTTTTSSVTSNSGGRGPQTANAFGIRLIYTTPLGLKVEKTLRATITKAERRFQIGTGWLLPPATTAAACGLNADLVRRSLLQNEVLFSSEGLTLLGLDRLYTFKSALAAYTRALGKAPMSPRSPALNSTAMMMTTTTEATRFIEDAVDELRRLVLANGGRQVSRADLHRSYDWMGVNAGALADVERMYRRAYGGRERAGAFEASPSEESEREVITRAASSRPIKPPQQQQQQQTAVVKIGTPPPPKNPTPLLKLNTNIATASPKLVRPKPKPVPQQQQEMPKEKEVIELEIKIDDISWIADEEDEDGDRTALPIQGMPFWNGLGASIDEMMLQQDDHQGRDSHQFLRQSQQVVGPLTPNGYDDISPITRGEWGFLFSGDGWKQGKTAAVETC